MDVEDEVPSRMVWIEIDHELIPATPAPVCAIWPIPVSDLEVVPTRQPEPITGPVEADDAVVVARANAVKAAMDIGLAKTEATVIGSSPAVPDAVVIPRGTVNAAVRVARVTRLGIALGPALWRVGSRETLAVLRRYLMPGLLVLRLPLGPLL